MKLKKENQSEDPSVLKRVNKNIHRRRYGEKVWNVDESN